MKAASSAWRHLHGSQKRTAWCLGKEAERLIDEYGIERVGFLTLTFKDKLWDRDEAQRRFNILATNVLRKRYQRGIVVTERHKDGGIHWHLLVVCPAPIRGAFDFGAFDESQDEFRQRGKSAKFRRLKGVYVRSAPKQLRAEWSYWRKVTGKDGVWGRHEILPVRKNGEAVAWYVTKYLCKASDERREDDKGKRLVRFLNYRWVDRDTGGWRTHRRFASQFAWVEAGRHWRRQLKIWAIGHRIAKYDDIAKTVRTSQWSRTLAPIIDTFHPANWPDWPPFDKARLGPRKEYDQGWAVEPDKPENSARSRDQCEWWFENGGRLVLDLVLENRALKLAGVL